MAIRILIALLRSCKQERRFPHYQSMGFEYSPSPQDELYREQLAGPDRSYKSGEETWIALDLDSKNNVCASPKSFMQKLLPRVKNASRSLKKALTQLDEETESSTPVAWTISMEVFPDFVGFLHPWSDEHESSILFCSFHQSMYELKDSRRTLLTAGVQEQGGSSCSRKIRHGWQRPCGLDQRGPANARVLILAG
ncbi:hypothetical protein Tco_1283366 [Tanacetum coccineum]